MVLLQTFSEIFFFEKRNLLAEHRNVTLNSTFVKCETLHCNFVLKR